MSREEDAAVLDGVGDVIMVVSSSVIEVVVVVLVVVVVVDSNRSKSAQKEKKKKKKTRKIRVTNLKLEKLNKNHLAFFFTTITQF